MSNYFVSPSYVAQIYIPESRPRRVLLFNPPVYDTRFPWSRWQQPVTLLQLATLLRRYQCDIRLIDALSFEPGKILTRRRMDVFKRGEVSINYWRFGKLSTELTSRLKSLSAQGWQPEEVYIEGFATIWWKGVAEAISLVRECFPHARIILYGPYVSLASEHAATYSGADLVVNSIEGLTGLPLDLSLYATRPSFTYLSIGTDTRSSSDLIEEFVTKVNLTNVKESIRQFAFADYDVVKRFPEQFQALLEMVVDQKIKVSFYALGNIHPCNLVDNPELASLLFRAGFKQLVFADDRDLPLTNNVREKYLEAYRHAIELCVAAGYQLHTEALIGSACIGRPQENVEEVTAFVTELAHVAGALIVVPYQPSPNEHTAHLPPKLELQNGKLFPFAEYNGVRYRTYQDLLGLAAVLNAKYRSHTFDFLGDSLISRLARSSLINESWNPHNNPATLNERPVIIGWFNKEGKWVRS